MAVLVLIHLIVMIYAIQGGLDSTEILSRTQGSFFWGGLYSLFVIAVSIHAAIGVRVILYEWLKISGITLNVMTLLIGFGLLSMGSYAVYAVTAS